VGGLSGERAFDPEQEARDISGWDDPQSRVRSTELHPKPS